MTGVKSIESRTLSPVNLMIDLEFTYDYNMNANVMNRKIESTELQNRIGITEKYVLLRSDFGARSAPRKIIQ